MTANQLRAVTDFERNLAPGQTVLAKWTAGSGGHYKAPAIVVKVSRASVRVVLIEAVETPWGDYLPGREIVVPLSQDSGLKKWTHYNRLEPVGGYQPIE